MGQFTIRDNDALVGLTGLEDLTTIDHLNVEGNRPLATLRDLGARSINITMDIRDNESLPSCEVEALVERLDWPPLMVFEENNGTGACPP
ncbi:hypothetical protein BE21_22805 [Sorangium cellulosum]|uniref:Uncharacterized protein n=1 Tax=Sorangium cellulosum TaxID=56 RepID=A0A150TV48_SORCE|nr:hypothetical protein BE21_22805 [Sorangium cellulosum]